MKKARKLPKTRNPMARALANSLFRQRTVPSKRRYVRQDRNQRGPAESE